MLWLSRKKSERIVLAMPDGREIVIVKGARRTIGVDAPEDVKVRREELVGEPLEVQGVKA